MKLTNSLLFCFFALLFATFPESRGTFQKSSDVTQKRLVVIDTDGGIDDALAILLTLTHQNIIRVLAITCVFGDTDVDNSCNNSLRELVLAESQGIPVHKGSPGSLTDGKYVSQLAYYVGVDGLGNRSSEFSTGQQQVSSIPAAVVLAQLARAHPGSITLLALGPLTNLALAHRLDPHFTHNLKEIVIMGGNYNGTMNAEFNFKCDPLAANIVLTEADCDVALVPYETATRNGIPWSKQRNELSKIFTKLGRFFQRITEVGSVREMQRGDVMYYTYDFLAAASILYPESVTSFDMRSLAVEYEGRIAQGVAVVMTKIPEKREVKIVTDFNETFIDLVLRVTFIVGFIRNGGPVIFNFIKSALH